MNTRELSIFCSLPQPKKAAPLFNVFSPWTFSRDLNKIIAYYIPADFIRWSQSRGSKGNYIRSYTDQRFYEWLSQKLLYTVYQVSSVYQSVLKNRYGKTLESFPIPQEPTIPTKVHTLLSYQQLYNANSPLIKCAFNFFNNAMEFYVERVPIFRSLASTPPFFSGEVEGKSLDEKALMSNCLVHFCAATPVKAGEILIMRLTSPNKTTRDMFTLTQLIEHGAIFKKSKYDVYALNYCAFYYDEKRDINLLPNLIESELTDPNVVQHGEVILNSILKMDGWKSIPQLEHVILSRYDIAEIIEPTERVFYRLLWQTPKNNDLNPVEIAQANVKLMLLSQWLRHKIDTENYYRRRGLEKITALINRITDEPVLDSRYEELAKMTQECWFLFKKFTFTQGGMFSQRQEWLGYGVEAVKIIELFQAKFCEFIAKFPSSSSHEFSKKAMGWGIFDSEHCKFGVSTKYRLKLHELCGPSTENEYKTSAKISA